MKHVKLATKDKQRIRMVSTLQERPKRDRHCMPVLTKQATRYVCEDGRQLSRLDATRVAMVHSPLG